MNRRSRQGPDHQVLKQWSLLPEEALRLLMLLIYQMEAGAMPMQTLMVYTGLLPKPAGRGGKTHRVDLHATPIGHAPAQDDGCQLGQ